MTPPVTQPQPSPQKPFEKSANPSQSQTQSNLSLIVNNDAKIAEDQTIASIAAANRPVIIITKESAKTYAGMMGYISKAFPNIPIIVENGGSVYNAPVCDYYMAKHVFRGNADTTHNQTVIKGADAIIIFGENQKAIKKQARPQQQIISMPSIAAASYSDTIQDKAGTWHAWNIKSHRGRCPV